MLTKVIKLEQQRPTQERGKLANNDQTLYCKGLQDIVKNDRMLGSKQLKKFPTFALHFFSGSLVHLFLPAANMLQGKFLLASGS